MRVMRVKKSTLAESWCYLTTRFKMFVLNCYELGTGYEKGCCKLSCFDAFFALEWVFWVEKNKEDG